MANSLDPKQLATLEEVLFTTVFQQEAMMNLLERKGLLSRAEVMAERTTWGQVHTVNL